MTDREKERIISEYREFWTLANELAEQDMERYPLEKQESKRNRMEKHLIGMLEMYQIRWGDPEERLRIVNFLERQLFRIPPIEDETSHLTYDMWKDLRQTILSGKHKELTGEAEKVEDR